MRLIDADALIEKWYEVNNIGPEDRGARFIGYTEIPRFINNAPTVETTGDYISRADAIDALRYLVNDDERHESDRARAEKLRGQILQYGASMCHSADDVSREEYEVLEAYVDTLVDALIKNGEELAESVKVVRCKDCKHYIIEGITTQYGWCHEYKHSVDEDDYCSYGERKK